MAATSSPPTIRSGKRYGVGRVASWTLLEGGGEGPRQATTSWFVLKSNPALGSARNCPGAETVSVGPKAAAPGASGATRTWLSSVSTDETIVTAAAPLAPTTRLPRP